MARMLQWLSERWVRYCSHGGSRCFRLCIVKLSRPWVAVIPDGPQNNINRKEGYRIINQTLSQEPRHDNSGGWVTGVSDGKSEIFLRKL